MQGHYSSFLDIRRAGQKFSVGSTKSPFLYGRVALARIYSPKKLIGGRFNVHPFGTPHTVVFILGIYTI
jgi:hypothetical protein